MVGFRLEQYRVHLYYRRDTGGLGLNNLRPSISLPSSVTQAFRDIFCVLNGAVR
jgi:hypothetical protein